ncbi:hypothetical protein LA080_016077 [Diaporthe eres]|nr:hypothetical protein LA080_016077 [Diaporthe eres]
MPSAVENTKPLPVYFIGHAGVGLLFKEDENNDIVKDNLRSIGDEILNVKKNTYIQHDFVKDFHDTQPFVYEDDWPHKDAPELAVDVWNDLRKAGIKAKRVERGVDHGIWVTLKVMFPPNKPLEVPVIQVSTLHGYDLESQIRLGEVIKTLRADGYLILGSGMAVHSFSSIGEIHQAEPDKRESVREKALAESRTFDTELRNAVTKRNAVDRRQALLALESLHEFRRSHPTIEHFTPFFVAAGAAGDAHVEPVGKDVVEPGMSCLNVSFK